LSVLSGLNPGRYSIYEEIRGGTTDPFRQNPEPPRRGERRACSFLAEYSHKKQRRRCCDVAMLTKTEKQEDTSPFAVGDHVYMWCTILVVGRYQHHGIVIYVDDDDKDVFTVAEFTQIVAPGEFSSASSSLSSSGNSEDRETTGRMRTVGGRIEGSKWQKVEYESSRENSLDTNTAISRSDPADMVLRRVVFLLENEDLIPPYHVLRSNCECVAVWCKTGRWATLQGSTIMLLMAAGPVKSAVGMGAYAAAQTVTVPMAGVWGFFGYTSQVALSAMYPFLIPLIAAYGATVTGASMASYFRCKHFWELTSTKLNTEFWQDFVAKSMMVHNEQHNPVIDNPK
jgi:hypothetical protein